MNYFCSKEIMVDNVARELENLKDIDIITLGIMVLQAFVYYAQREDNSNSKGLKHLRTIYKSKFLSKRQTMHGVHPPLIHNRVFMKDSEKKLVGVTKG